MVPGDVITSFSGKTIEILNADAEGRLILADGLTWAAEREGCTHLVDAATLTGAIWAMLGYVTTGVMANDDAFYDCLTRAAKRSGERFWRIPDYPEYEKLIESDYADVRNTSKDGCGAITAGLFLKKFAEGRPWLRWTLPGQRQRRHRLGSIRFPQTGTAVSTLYQLAQVLFLKQRSHGLNTPLIEACVDSYASCKAASLGGADRLELCAHLVIGGTTPSPALFRQVARDIPVKINVLDPPALRRFSATARRKSEQMCEEIQTFRDLGAKTAL